MHFPSPAAQLSSQLHDLSLNPCARNTWFPLDIRLGENLSQYLSFAEEENLFPCLFYEKAEILDQCW